MNTGNTFIAQGRPKYTFQTCPSGLIITAQHLMPDLDQIENL